MFNIFILNYCQIKNTEFGSNDRHCSWPNFQINPLVFFLRHCTAIQVGDFHAVKPSFPWQPRVLLMLDIISFVLSPVCILLSAGLWVTASSFVRKKKGPSFSGVIRKYKIKITLGKPQAIRFLTNSMRFLNNLLDYFFLKRGLHPFGA